MVRGLGVSSENCNNLREKENCVSQQQCEKAECVRRLQLSYLHRKTDGSEGKSDSIHSLSEDKCSGWSEDRTLPEKLDSESAGSVVPPVIQKDSSLLVLESQQNLFDSPLPLSSPSPSVDSPEELYTTALEASTTPISPPPSPSIPFLAESLKRIQLRRQALRSSHQQQSLTPPHTAYSVQKALPGNTVAGSKSVPGGQSVPLPSDRSHRVNLTVECRNRTSPNPEEMPAEEDDAVSEALLKPDYTNSSLLANCSFAADITTQIPRHLHNLTNQELRQRLVARGEQPGPITELTRPAYLVYLSKLEAGIQPAGNTGYKG